ncbi:MAG: AAA-like domain-containing protein [Chloroflexota bacterium]
METFSLILVMSTEASFLIKNLAHSPFFNIATTLVTQDFTPDQLQRLNQQYNQCLTEAELNDCLDLLGGHPFLTRMALYKLSIEADWSWPDLVGVAQHEDGPFGLHLYYYQKLLRNKPELRQGLIEIINTQTCADEERLYTLMRAGLIKRGSNGYVCRCRLYEHYFKDKLG